MDKKHLLLMNKTYKKTKYIYDFSRAFFLFGRIGLRQKIQPKAGQRVLEIGCGTGRNLSVLAKKYPDAQFVGLDVSSEMLSYAQTKIKSQKLSKNITFFHGDIFDYQEKISGQQESAHGYDYIFFSYSLSMIPDWENVLRQAVEMLCADSGTLVIVDFWTCHSWPKKFTRQLFKNLNGYNVHPRLHLTDFFESLPDFEALDLRHKSVWGGYAQLIELQKRT